MKRLIVALAFTGAFILAVGGICFAQIKPAAKWSCQERKLIGSKEDVCRVLTVNNAKDLKVLRGSCVDFPKSLVASVEYETLCRKMIATVTSPQQDGVGIAGPQVGISRRIVAVQRFDKAGEPFEVYPNIRITKFSGQKVTGPEGCLSVPDCRGDVERYRDIEITYLSPASLRDTTEHITGFTAVIFQHECDHLDGIIYTDHIITAPTPLVPETGHNGHDTLVSASFTPETKQIRRDTAKVKRKESL